MSNTCCICPKIPVINPADCNQLICPPGLKDNPLADPASYNFSFSLDGGGFLGGTYIITAFKGISNFQPNLSYGGNTSLISPPIVGQWPNCSVRPLLSNEILLPDPGDFMPNSAYVGTCNLGPPFFICNKVGQCVVSYSMSIGFIPGGCEYTGFAGPGCSILQLIIGGSYVFYAISAGTLFQIVRGGGGRTYAANIPYFSDFTNISLACITDNGFTITGEHGLNNAPTPSAAKILTDYYSLPDSITVTKS